jgi:hypothetical protein
VADEQRTGVYVEEASGLNGGLWRNSALCKRRHKLKCKAWMTNTQGNVCEETSEAICLMRSEIWKVEAL